MITNRGGVSTGVSGYFSESSLENQQVSGMDIGMEELAFLNGKGPNLGAGAVVMGLGSGFGLSGCVQNSWPRFLSEQNQSLSSQMLRR